MQSLILSFILVFNSFLLFAQGVDDKEPLFDAEEPPFLVRTLNLNYPAYQPVHSEESYRFYFLIGPYLPKKLHSNSYSYSEFFENKKKAFTGFELEFQLFDNWGTTGIKTGVFLFIAREKGLYSGEALRSYKTVTLWVLPIQALLVQTFRFTDNQVLVPYVESGLSYFPFFQTMEDSKTYKGGRSLIVLGFGLKVLLDWIDYSSAWKLDSTHGINNSYLVINYRILQNINTARGMDFSSRVMTFGFALDF